MIINIEYQVGDKVLLPANETGTIIKINERLWASEYIVKIRKGGVFNRTNQKVSYLKKHLKPEKVEELIFED